MNAQSLNANKLWSYSGTKHILTDYAEGLAVHNFDQKNNYHVRRYEKYKWLVTHKFSDVKQKASLKPKLKFTRVRSIQIENGYMSCTCGYEKRFLMPCCHMCAIISNPLYYTPTMFNV